MLRTPVKKWDLNPEEECVDIVHRIEFLKKNRTYVKPPPQKKKYGTT